MGRDWSIARYLGPLVFRRTVVASNGFFRWQRILSRFALRPKRCPIVVRKLSECCPKVKKAKKRGPESDRRKRKRFADRNWLMEWRFGPLVFRRTILPRRAFLCRERERLRSEIGRFLFVLAPHPKCRQRVKRNWPTSELKLAHRWAEVGR